MPILVLTGCTRVVDRVLCLDLSADDYLGKPVLAVDDQKLDRVERGWSGRLREMNWSPRDLRRKARRLEEAQMCVDHKLKVASLFRDRLSVFRETTFDAAPARACALAPTFHCYGRASSV